MMKRMETQQLTACLVAALPVMKELELLIDEKAMCEAKLAELKDLLKNPPKRRVLPLVSRFLKTGFDEQETRDQIVAYQSMVAGLNGHMLQLVMHQCRDIAFLKDDMYPMAVQSFARSLEDGAAENLKDAGRIYEARMNRLREQSAEREQVLKAERQKKVMGRLSAEVKRM